MEDYLRQCLDSITAQTFTDWECILVDDGSKDKSGSICDEYAKKDNRFKVIHKKNAGVAQTRITGFENSKGELITFVDADDIIEPDCLEKLSLPMIKEGADMVSCDYYIVENDKKRLPCATLTGTYKNEQIVDFIAQHYFYDKKTKSYGMTCFLWSKMVKREYILEGLRKGLGLWFGEDQISMFTMLLQCKKLVLIPDRLYNYIQHEGQTIKRYDASLWDNIIKMLSRYESLLPDKSGNKGLRMRTWLYILQTHSRMLPAQLDRATYTEHMSRMRNNSFMKRFFQPMCIQGNLKTNILYWILKMKCYNLFYIRFYARFL